MQKKNGKVFSLLVILALIFGGIVTKASAGPITAISLTGGTYTQDFNALSNVAGTTTNTLTITDWYMTESGTSTRNNGQYAVDTGASNSGDTYSYGSAGSTDRALGGLRSGSLIPLFGAQFTNSTGAAIGSLTISYTGEQWRLGTTGRTDQLNFELSTDATDLVTGVWTHYTGLDFISPYTTTVGARDGNAAGNRTAISYTITNLNIPNGSSFWIRWSDIDATYSDDGLAIDDFSITSAGLPALPALGIDDVTLNEGDAGTTTFAFTVSLTAPAPAGGVTFDISTADNSATVADNDYVARSLTSQMIPEGSSAYTFDVTVNGDATVEANETFYVNVSNITGATFLDGQGLGTINNDDVTVTRIHDIQGSGGSITGVGPFTVEAIVVGDYQTQGSGRLRGFFLQEEDSDIDSDSGTSEGIFVFCSSCPVAVTVGDKVRVTGSASEYFNMSQLTASTLGSVIVQSTVNTLPTPATLDLPIPGVPTGDFATAQTFIYNYYEAFEGMLVTFPATLSVSEYFELARYGQVILSANGRPRTFTDANIPTTTGYTNHLIDLESRTIILDDTDNRQNRPVDVPNTAYYHPVPGLSTTNYFRGGDTITNLTGVLHWSFAGQSGTDAWRIRPVTEAFSYAFTPINPRPSLPAVGGSLKVASFNVLNYFLTIDTSNVCGPTANQDCRGADSVLEFDRQRAKLLAALTTINADIFGLMEMENTLGVEPLADIVAGMPGYAYIDTGIIGGDTIRVGIIYKTSTVQPVGNFAILDSNVDVRFVDTRNRPALAQTFEQVATGERFTLVVNHLKSKGDSGLATDPTCTANPPTNPDCDLGNGQGFWNDTRVNAALALADWLASDPTGSGDPDNLIIGDMNSYAMEDPITTLQSAGYTNLVAAFGGNSAYGYVFDGQLGYLDHALANATLQPQVVGVADWHINADENPLFDYNDDARTADEASYEEESDVWSLYEPNEFRTSDHDPVLIGLNLDTTPPVLNLPADMLVAPTSPSGAVVSYIVTATDLVDPNPVVSCQPPSGSIFPIGVTTVNCTATDASGNVANGSFTITVGGTAYILKFRSNAENDGTLRESSELSGLGNWAVSTNQLIAIGDDYLKRQYVGILDFNTSSLPDNAVVTGAKLRVKVMFLSKDVYARLGNLLADITKPYFGTLPGLQNMDFSARSLAPAGIFTKATGINQWITLPLKSSSLIAVNRTGQTQFRVHFTLDDNNDLFKDQIGFLSGNYPVLTDRPVLVITYYLP